MKYSQTFTAAKAAPKITRETMVAVRVNLLGSVNARNAKKFETTSASAKRKIVKTSLFLSSSANIFQP